MSDAALLAPEYGVREDPLVHALEKRAAHLLGKEDALFCPTCTMCNQIAIKIATQPGDTVACEESAHAFTNEMPSPAGISGVVARPLHGRLGRIDPALLEAVLNDTEHPRPALVLLENTHVHSGGTVVPLEEMRAIRAIAAHRDVPVHLDGSRIWNAAAYLGVSAAEVAQSAHSVSASLNKGLAAPVGAVLAGSRAFIAEATRLRSMLGGAWRPATIPAAAGLVALDEMRKRIVDDHAAAARLAAGLRAIDGLAVDAAQVQTNIVLVRVERPGLDPQAVVDRLRDRGIATFVTASGAIRLVTYYEIGPDAVRKTIDAFADVVSAAA